jgi:hypothetical protein
MKHIKQALLIALIAVITGGVVYYAMCAVVDDVHRSTRGDGP